MANSSADLDLIRQALEIDPDRSTFVLALGRKGSGKSEALRMIFDAWPYDRGIIDITGDCRPDDPETIAIGMPGNVDREHYRRHPDDRLTFWVRVTPQQPAKSFYDQQDDAMALGLYPKTKPFYMLVDEFGRLMEDGRARQNMALAIESSRHYDLSLGLAAPRPVFIGPLSIAQADIVLIHELPNAGDRKMIAENIGFPFKLFEAAYQANQERGRRIALAAGGHKSHSFLVWHAGLGRMFDSPPLPIVRAHGGRA